jgi:predicted nucleic acid-binding Zn ribbon protein
MPYYNVCEICGANLDPGEKCTCQEEAKAEEIRKEAKRKADVFLILQNYGKKRGKK